MNHKPNESRWNRRQFLTRSVKAAASIAAVGAAGLWFHDSRGPTRAANKPTETALLDFSIAGLNPKMAIVRGSDRHATLHSALKALGGIETFIKKEDRVLLKVNAAFASPPMLSATTHPEIVSEMARLLEKTGDVKRHGAVMVVGKDGKLVGIITDADLRRLVTKQGKKAFEFKVADVMTANCKRIRADALASEATALFHKYRIDELPVVDSKDKPVGLIDVQDIVTIKVVG